mgnify:CR=1 FL=1
MASKPTEMCVVEKSGAREYKVLLLLLFSFLFFLLRLFLASVSFFHHLIACCDYSFFFSLSLSLSLSAVTRSGGSPSLVVDVWRWKGGGRTSRAVLFSRPVEFRRRRLFVSSQKLGAKRRAPLLETIGLRRKSVVDTTAPQNRAQFNRAARDARERVGTISARLSRGKWICPRESTATFEMRGRGWVVDDEASTKRHDQSRRSLFFSLFFIFLEKNFETFGCETFLIRPMKICVHIFVCVLS